MKTREELLKTLRRFRPELEREFAVGRLAIFGSYARGDATEASDVDILVDLVSRRAIRPRHWALIEKELLDVA